MNWIKQWLHEAQSGEFGVLGPCMSVTAASLVWAPQRIRLWMLLALLVYNVTQYIELAALWSEPRLVVINLSMSVLCTTCWVRGVVLAAQESRWKVLATAVGRGSSAGCDAVLSVAMSFWALVAVTLGATLFPALRGEPPISSWWPCCAKWPLVPLQVVFSALGASWLAAFDGLVLATVTALIYQLRDVAERCQRIFDNDHDTANEIRYCAQRHAEILQCVKILTAVSRWGVLVYLCVCAVLVCISGAARAVWLGGALVAQLGAWAAAGTALTTAGEGVRAALSLSRWHRAAQCPRIARSLRILLMQTEAPIKLRAAPFATLSMDAFVTILKAAYSYFTLIDQTEH